MLEDVAADRQRLVAQRLLKVRTIRETHVGEPAQARTERDTVRRDGADAGDRRELYEQLGHLLVARRRVAILHFRKLRCRREQMARGFDELILLRRRQPGQIQRLLRDRGLELLTVLDQPLHLERQHRQRRDQHQDQKADAQLHRHLVPATISPHRGARGAVSHRIPPLRNPVETLNLPGGKDSPPHLGVIRMRQRRRKPSNPVRETGDGSFHPEQVFDPSRPGVEPFDRREIAVRENAPSGRLRCNN